MRGTRLVVFGAMALSLVAANALFAQQSNNAKKPPKQTHDKGIDDPDPSPATTIGERLTGGVTTITRGDGTVVALLDESFHDALVATRNADGSMSYTCLHGLPAGAKHVEAHKTPVSSKTSVSKTPVSKTPVLEEK